MNIVGKTRYVVYLDSCYDEVLGGLIFDSDKPEEEFLGDALADWLEEATPIDISSTVLDELKTINARLSWIETHLANADITIVKSE